MSGAAGWRKSGPTAQPAKSVIAARAAASALNHLTDGPCICNRHTVATEYDRTSSDLTDRSQHYFRSAGCWLCSVSHTIEYSILQLNCDQSQWPSDLSSARSETGSHAPGQ